MENLLGKRLKKLREERGYTSVDLGRKITLIASSIEAFEEGKRIPELEHITKIKKFFGVSLCYLIGMVDEPTEIIDVSEKFQGFHINSSENLTKDEIKNIRLLASDTSLYMNWYLDVTKQKVVDFLDDF